MLLLLSVIAPLISMFTRNLVAAIQSAYLAAFVAVLVVFLYVVPIFIPVSSRSIHATLLTTTRC